MHINSIFQCFRGNCRIYVQNVGDVCVFFVLGFFGELFSGYILRFEFEHNLTCENILGYFLYVFFGYILWFENEQKKQFKKCAYKRLRVFFFGENFRVQNFFEIQPTICLYILSTIVKFRASFLGNLGTKKFSGKSRIENLHNYQIFHNQEKYLVPIKSFSRLLRILFKRENLKLKLYNNTFIVWFRCILLGFFSMKIQRKICFIQY
eukprot:TRINITY_DN3586_c0_g1_i9.p3 TRINITY_DN3586_c0_g1~~TRINITY_DN3586_c0_g1_i9.p3  ORF type:complete len:207 (-),score=-1.49 TRINITY_DN3586_c0_g1_i9:761-1381(-)